MLLVRERRCGAAGYLQRQGHMVWGFGAYVPHGIIGFGVKGIGARSTR
jgi:hypothetical protein